MKKGIGAYFTVEAAFIFPIIVIFTIAAIWLCLFLVNRLKFEADSEYIVTMAEKYVTEGYLPNYSTIDYQGKLNRHIFYPLERANEEEYALIRESAKKQFESGYLLARVKDIDVTLDHSSVTLKAVLQMNIGTTGLTGKLIKSFSTITYTKERKFIDRSERRRGIEVAVRTGEKIKGVTEAANMIKKIFGYIN